MNLILIDNIRVFIEISYPGFFVVLFFTISQNLNHRSILLLRDKKIKFEIQVIAQLQWYVMKCSTKCLKKYYNFFSCSALSMNDR